MAEISACHFLILRSSWNCPVFLGITQQQTMQKCKGLKKNVRNRSLVSGDGIGRAALWARSTLRNVPGSFGFKHKRNVKPDKTTRPYISERLKLIFSNNRSSWPLYTKLQIHTQISKCYNIWPQKIKDIILIPNVPTVQLNIFTFKVLHSKMKNIHVCHTTGLCESQTSFMILL